MLVLESQQYRKWKTRIRNKELKHRINARIRWILKEERLVGDYKALGEGVFELRFLFGAGYRVYVSFEKDRTLLLLLVGGDKSSQQEDITQAKQLVKVWRRENE